MTRPRRRWFPRGAFGLDFEGRNRAGSPSAQRGSEQAALARRRKKTVSLAPAGTAVRAAERPGADTHETRGEQ